MKNDIFLYVKEILHLERLEILRLIEKHGTLEIRRKVWQYCNQIFRYTFATGHMTINSASR